MSSLSWMRRGSAWAAVFATLLLLAGPLVTAPADARAGGGFSFGSRGSRTFSMPSPTTTAPRYANPIQRSDTPRFGPAASQPRRFGFGTGLLAGLLGAGLMGSMFGGGFFYGIAALFGLMIKLALIGGLIWLVIRFVRGRSPALAGGPMGYARSGLAGGMAGGARSGATVSPAEIVSQDYAAFEANLAAIQDAYSREDLSALSRLATPEMVRQFSVDLDENRRRGLRNDVSRTRLLQGDLSEAWREGTVTYATVAMRFAAVDVMLDRATGRIASGDAVHPVEVTELWTFRRDGTGSWQLSAIQQAG